MTRVSLYIICLLLFTIGLNADDEFSKDGEVLVLKNENLKKAITSIKCIMVVFCKFYLSENFGLKIYIIAINHDFRVLSVLQSE